MIRADVPLVERSDRRVGEPHREDEEGVRPGSGIATSEIRLDPAKLGTDFAADISAVTTDLAALRTLMEH